MFGHHPRLATVSVLACLATPASAQPRFYQDFSRPQFFADAGSVATYDFEPGSGFATAPSALSSLENGRVRFSTPGFAANAALAAFGGTQALTGAGGADRPLRIDFASANVFAFAFDNLDLTVQPLPHPSPSEFALIRVSFYGGSSPIEYLVNNTTGQYPATVFFGLISDVAISSVQISATPFPGVLTPTPHYIDNLTIGTAVVPEPATVALFGAGLLSVAAGAAARRRVS